MHTEPQSQLQRRASGILLPVSSLPSPWGIGSFGADARRWVDFLHDAGQRYWQVLPLGPTGFGDSPYQSVSAFAGNPWFIDLDLLCEEGLLLPEECKAVLWGENPASVDYLTLFRHREPLLRRAFSRLTDRRALRRFREENAAWIEEYALYMALKSARSLRPWQEWEEELRLREPVALARERANRQESIDYYVFEQYAFYKQWRALKEYANSRQVQIIGDIPIYVAMDSADTWANGSLFLLDEAMQPIEVAGCPPDAFSEDGQLWGNPLYRWDVLREEGYAWWLRRLEACLSMYDVLRIDHFRGFESYYAIPADSKTAAAGRWRPGPGMDFLNAVNRRFPGADIIAEDLGFLTPETRALLDDSGYPGMKVLQFAFDSREESDYMPHNYQRHCVVYTGTHDNDTVLGWFASAPPEDVQVARDYLGLEKDAQGAAAFIRAALGSVAGLAVVPMQDWLDLDGEARMNIPSTIGGKNWRWRMEPKAAAPALAARIAKLTRLYGRTSSTGVTPDPVR